MNVLVVGTGSFGRFRGESFARRGCSVAFASRDLERARKATRSLSGPEEHANDIAWADGVFVATPPACHTEHVLEAALQGKRVLVEKPVEATLERARSLEKALEGRAGLVSVAENYRFLPQIPLVRELEVETGRFVEAAVLLHRPRPPSGWRVERALSGGGILADMGVHYLHLLRVLLGELHVERAEERARVPGTDVDGAFFLEGSAAGGARFTIDMSWLSLFRRSSVTLRGPRGALRFRVGRSGLWRVGWLGLPYGRRALPPGDEYGHEALHDHWLRSLNPAPPPAKRGEAGRGDGEGDGVSLREGIEDLAHVALSYSLALRKGTR